VRARSAALALAAGVLALTGCSAPEPPTSSRETTIDVDTPSLRDLRTEIGVDPCEPGPSDAVDSGLPELTLPCLGGGEDVDLSSLDGPVLINLWASWCGPCRTEMPVLQQFYRQYGDRVPVIGIDMTDNSPVAALALMRDSGATYPSLADPTGVLLEQPDLRIANGYPQFILLRADGTVVQKRLTGGVDSVAEVVDYVETGLGTRL